MAFIYVGNDLLSHTLTRAVQSAQRGLTSVFGMGTGGTPAVRSPTSRSSELRGMSLEPKPLVERSSLQTFKDREDETSQLNRLDGLLSSCLFPISAFFLLGKAFLKKHRRKASAELPTSAQVLANG